MKTRGAALDQDLSIPLQGDTMVIYALSDRVPSKKGKQLAYHGMNRGGILIDFSKPSSCDRVFRNERVQLTLSHPFSSFDTTTFLARLSAALKAHISSSVASLIL